jgi:TMEM175 potassium channel family protein
MTKGRVEAFSDGVIAILITIMVLELKAPAGPHVADLRAVAPSLGVYVASFIYLGIYWNNHHHLFHLVDHVDGRILWANLLLLFWLSLVPFVTSWITEEGFAASVPSAAYGVVLLLAALSYTLLVRAIIARQGTASRLAAAVGRDRKGKASLIMYLLAIGVAAVKLAVVADVLYVAVALMWLIPDRRVERALGMQAHAHGDSHRGRHVASSATHSAGAEADSLHAPRQPAE